MTKYEIWCTGCRCNWEMHPKTILKRFETTRVFKPDTVYKAAVCSKCGSLVKPFLKELDDDEL